MVNKVLCVSSPPIRPHYSLLSSPSRVLEWAQFNHGDVPALARTRAAIRRFTQLCV